MTGDVLRLLLICWMSTPQDTCLESSRLLMQVHSLKFVCCVCVCACMSAGAGNVSAGDSATVHALVYSAGVSFGPATSTPRLTCSISWHAPWHALGRYLILAHALATGMRQCDVCNKCDVTYSQSCSYAGIHSFGASQNLLVFSPPGRYTFAMLSRAFSCPPLFCDKSVFASCGNGAAGGLRCCTRLESVQGPSPGRIASQARSRLRSSCSRLQTS